MQVLFFKSSFPRILLLTGFLAGVLSGLSVKSSLKTRSVYGISLSRRMGNPWQPETLSFVGILPLFMNFHFT